MKMMSIGVADLVDLAEAVDPKRPPFEVRGVALVRCGQTGRPRFDLPMCEYPLWAQDEFRKMLTPAEVREFFA